VTLLTVAPTAAARLVRLHPDGQLGLDGETMPEKAPAAASTWMTTAQVHRGTAPSQPAGSGHDVPPSLEALGVYRGRGTYAAVADLTDVDELLLVGGADLVDITVADRPRPTVATFGATERIDVRDVSGPAELRCTVEIWGHANFDDARLPALRLGSLRGLGTLWTVIDVRDLSAGWAVSGAPQWATDPPPIRSLGGWSSTRIGLPITYRRALETAPDTVSALHLAGLSTPVALAVDGGEPITVHPENPWALLPAGTAQISLTAPHQPGTARYGRSC
jgi:beta-galactosidase